MAIRYLSQRTLEQLVIPTARVVEAIESTIRNASAGTVLSAPKSVALPADGRYVMTTLAVCDDPPLTAVKSLVLSPHTAARGLPSIDGIVTLIDSHTGAPRGLVDAKWVTAVRTAGLSMLAANYLARPEASTVAFVGCGVQARAHLAQFAELYPLTDVVLVGRGQANIDLMIAQSQQLGLSARHVSDANEAIADADLIVSSLTRAPERAPFLDATTLRAGAFATITDLAEPWLPHTLSAFDRLVIDDTAQEAASEHKLTDPAWISGDLTDLVTGRVDGRRTPDERTAFVFRGLGLGDLAIAILALQEAERAGLGQVLED